MLPATQDDVIARLRQLIHDGFYLFRIELNLAYALRVLALSRSEATETLVATLYESQVSSFIKRDIVLIMAQWHAEYWISDKKNHYGQVHPWIKRALLTSSYVLGDEGRHWRRAIKPGLGKFELAILEWAGEKASIPGWTPPL